MRKVEKQFGRWLASLDMGWWDDAADGGQFLDSLQQAFEAGRSAARKQPRGRLRADFNGQVCHNGATIPGQLVVTIGGDYKRGSVIVAFDEPGLEALKAGLVRCGVI